MDLIDREKALGCFWNYANDDGTGYDETNMPAYDRLQALPIVAEVEDCISRQAARDELAKLVPYAIYDDASRAYTDGLTDAYNLICQLPPAQPDKRLEKIADLVEGTIDHFDRDDAMDLLYQIKEVLNER